jgi:hypothetical protein
VADDLQTVLLMQMGQFIDHDITSTPTSSSSCCKKGGKGIPDTFDGDKCFPITIPVDDPFWKGRKTCMSFARSLASPGLKCELEFRQQVIILHVLMIIFAVAKGLGRHILFSRLY